LASCKPLKKRAGSRSRSGNQ